jgi:hypothetical protein
MPNTDVAFTPSVKAEQEKRGSRAAYAKVEARGGWQASVTPDLASFLERIDTFFLGTSNGAGQPYIQHRGGPRGFLKVIDEKTLAFADFRGNRQYISLGNLAENARVFLFLMDFAQARRIKIWGTAAVVEDDPALLARLSDSTYDGVPERAIVITIEAWDPNCRQHITPRFTLGEIEAAVAPLRMRIAALEAEVARLRAMPPMV